MWIRYLLRGATIICSSAIILSGCGGSKPIAIPDASVVSARAHAEVANTSWMDPGASVQDLLYISSNDRGNVYAYTYPQGQLVGTLTGFISPFGECTDAAGDIFVVAYSAPSTKSSTIYEYAHGGTTPIATLSDPNGAFGCAVDPTTGNLAASGAGVAIYKHAAGNPKLYFSGVALYYCSYDERGNLYLSGVNSQHSDQAALYRFRRGSRDLEHISINATIYTFSFEGPPVQWYRKYLAVSSITYRKPITIYRLRISGSQATIIGSTILTARKPANVFGMTWIQGNAAIGLGPFKRGYENAYLWPYPRGGNPQRTIRKVADVKQQLWGVAVSLAPSR